MASAKFHVPLEVAGPTGATAATRYAGATTSGAPGSGSFLKGDFVVDQTGKMYVCTVAGSPGTWVDVGGGTSGIPQGGPLTEDLDADSNTIINLVDPTNDQDAATKKYVDDNAGGEAPIGTPELIYRYTVTGSDKSSIDTGVDTADAGTNDWTNGDVLEIWMMLRSDNAAARVSPVINLNNDSNAVYDGEFLGAVNTTVSAAGRAADTSWSAGLDIHGSGGSSGYASAMCITIPNYTGTTFNKVAILNGGVADGTATNESTRFAQMGYRSTSAITRFKVAAGGSDKFKVGSQLLIYKRRSA